MLDTSESVIRTLDQGGYGVTAYVKVRSFGSKITVEAHSEKGEAVAVKHLTDFLHERRIVPYKYEAKLARRLGM